MPKLRFNSGPAMVSYIDRPNWNDGDEREVSEDVAKQLLGSHSDHFSPADDKAKAITKALGKTYKTKEQKQPENKDQGEESSSGDDGGFSGDGSEANDECQAAIKAADLTADEGRAYAEAFKKIADGKSIEDFTDRQKVAWDKVEASKKE